MSKTNEQLRIGQRVRFVCGKDRDIYHGECVGRSGVVEQLYPFVGVRFGRDTGIKAVAGECLREARDE